jgi:hypothetical protein
MFSWRYQLPQLVLLPPAAAIGITALAGWRHQHANEGAVGEPRDAEKAWQSQPKGLVTSAAARCRVVFSQLNR